MTKFYRADNAGRPIAGVQFHVYDVVAGTACGVFKTDDPKVIAAIAREGKKVQEIDEAEYEFCVKKNPPRQSSWRPLAVLSPAPMRPTPSGHAPSVGNIKIEKPDEPIELKGQVESVEEALTVGKVNQPAEDAKPVETQSATVQEPEPTKSNARRNAGRAHRQE